MTVNPHAVWMWGQLDMVMPDELDPDKVRINYHHSLLTPIAFFGVERVWAIGLDALGYPPTWVHSKSESQLVHDALLADARTRHGIES